MFFLLGDSKTPSTAFNATPTTQCVDRDGSNVFSLLQRELKRSRSMAVGRGRGGLHLRLSS
jgi:hypothetical protein